MVSHTNDRLYARRRATWTQRVGLGVIAAISACLLPTAAFAAETMPVPVGVAVTSSPCTGNTHHYSFQQGSSLNYSIDIGVDLTCARGVTLDRAVTTLYKRDIVTFALTPVAEAACSNTARCFTSTVNTFPWQLGRLMKRQDTMFFRNPGGWSGAGACTQIDFQVIRWQADADFVAGESNYIVYS